MRILVGCEFSGRVRDAFRARGHEAVSVDLLPSERPGPHVITDIRNILSPKWDMMIAFPPCTYLARSGARWYWGSDEQEYALEFVQVLMDAPISRIAIENPVGAISTRIRKPDCIIQPWQFGHAESKATCLWLKNLPVLEPTDIVTGPIDPRVHWTAPGPNRWKWRSRTLPGIAAAMAEQWGRT